MLDSLTSQIREEETARFKEIGAQSDCVSFGIAQASLPLADFLWVSTTDVIHNAHKNRAPVVDLDDAEIRTSSVLRYAIERKTYKDLAGRYGKGDHLSQLRRLAHSSIVTKTFILFEGCLEISAGHDTYGSQNVNGIQPEQVDAIAVDCILNIGECAGSRTLFTSGEKDTQSTLVSMTRVIRDQFHEELSSEGEEKDNSYDSFRKQCGKDSKEVKQNTLQRTEPIDMDVVSHLREECFASGCKKKIDVNNICTFLAPIFKIGGLSLNSTRQLPFPCNIFNCNSIDVSVAVVHVCATDLLTFIGATFFSSAVDESKPSNVLQRIKQLAAICDEGWSGGRMPSRRLLVLEKAFGQYGGIRKKISTYVNSSKLNSLKKKQAAFFVDNLFSIVYDFCNCLIIRHGWHLKQSSDHKQTCRFLSVMAIRSSSADSSSDRETVDLVGSESENDDDEVIDLCSQ